MKKIVVILSAILLVVALAVPSFAAGFTPSVEQKGAPTVVSATDADGNAFADGEVIVTPVSAADSADAAIADGLKAAYEQIKAAATLTDIAPSIGDYLKEIGSEASVEDLVVRDLFDVSVTGVAAESSPITVRFNLGLSQSATLIVLHNYEGSNWEIIPDDRVVQNADGTVDVTFDSLSPIAFVVDSTETDTSASTDANAPTSPQTGDSSLPPVAGAGLIALGCVALASAAVVWKKRAQN